jgi:hypothetical protein
LGCLGIFLSLDIVQNYEAFHLLCPLLPPSTSSNGFLQWIKAEAMTFVATREAWTTEDSKSA